MEGLDLVNLNVLPKSALRRKFVLGSGICLLLLAAEYYGLVSGLYRWFKRFGSESADFHHMLGFMPLVRDC